MGNRKKIKLRISKCYGSQLICWVCYVLQCALNSILKDFVLS